MSLGCARCGDCCDPVKVDFDVWARAVAYARSLDAEQIADEDRDYWADCVFLASRCRPVSASDTQVRLECSSYDREHGTCRDYANRPPVCRRFPHYDGENVGEICESRCSYLLDVPPAERGEGARPLIPLTVIRSAWQT